MSNSNLDNIMRPEKGDYIINLPVTFDYSGGRKDTNKSKILWSCVLLVVGVIVGFGIIFADRGFFLFNLVAGVLFMFGVTLIIRFLILKEHKIREEYIKLEDSDYLKDFHDLWGIFSIDDTYPYYVHFRNGKSGLFVMFEKDVILGKIEDSQYNHYEAIGDAYNLAGSMNIGMCHVDYMGNIGSDERLVECFNELSNVENPDIRDLLTDIYTNLQLMMNECVSTFDVYVFTFNSSESSFWYNIKQVISCMLEANYVSFKILNQSDLREVTKSLFNIHDFSVVEASSEAFGTKKYAGVIPISVVSADGVETILNKTTAEKNEERKLKERELRLKKEEDRRRKKNKNQIKDVSEKSIDIFN